MIELPLHNSEGLVVAVAAIDDEDVHHAEFDWYRLVKGYVVRTARRRTFYLHREVMGVSDQPRRIHVDHKDGDRLNNQRANLRVGNAKLNAQNRGANVAHPWPRGVTRRGRRGWEAHAKLDGRWRYLGIYPSPEEAGRAASAFRAEHMPWSADARSLEASGAV